MHSTLPGRRRCWCLYTVGRRMFQGEFLFIFFVVYLSCGDAAPSDHPPALWRQVERQTAPEVLERLGKNL